jgi:hypothetical protein
MAAVAGKAVEYGRASQSPEKPSNFPWARGGHGLPKISPEPAMPEPSTRCRRASPEMSVLGVARLQDRLPGAVFYPLGHPTPYARASFLPFLSHFVPLHCVPGIWTLTSSAVCANTQTESDDLSARKTWRGNEHPFFIQIYTLFWRPNPITSFSVGCNLLIPPGGGLEPIYRPGSTE